MPLIVLCGFPSSGKSKRAQELKDYFEQQGKEVSIISECSEILKAGFEKNNFFNDAHKEKHIRGLLKSEVLKLITPRNVVILDASNYIKGYRYELYCASKANHSTQCTVFTLINKDIAWDLNENRVDAAEKYDRKTFDGLIMRFEEPNGNSRWDAPLFVTMNDSELECKAISDSLFEKKAPPPNMSTQNAPLSSTNFLYDMNKIIKEITMAIVTLINSGCLNEVSIPGRPELTLDLTHATVPKVISLSRQYLNYSKINTPDIKVVPQLYVQYLKTNLN
ncbi:PREDICTED: protein KTI12 homolog [Nicrophorus vespilloides]|uniref:Protein KTI12 homolog n=1 Tax=Nicrophorus vespilloides TaxID=110193 RepID=A0ABM1NEB6_NICVS|nr:PREDICTED: protein KTI12 homolog [Nicrophorus vespilloides]